MASIFSRKVFFYLSFLVIAVSSAFYFCNDQIVNQEDSMGSTHTVVDTFPPKETDSSQKTSNEMSFQDVDLDEEMAQEQRQPSEKLPAKVIITLPSGTTIERFFDTTAYMKLPRMTNDNIEVYLSELKAMAMEGNGAAAYEVYNLLKICSGAARSENEYRRREAVIHAQPAGNSPLSIDNQLLANRMTYLLCIKVTDDELESLERWQNLALENHSKMAMSEEARKLLFESPAKAGEIYKELWNRGHATAGHALTYVYRITDFDGQDPSKPNLVKAHAYRVAKDIIDKHVLQEKGGIDLANSLTQIEQGQAISAARLSLQEQQEAEDLAIELLIENESCCIDEWNFR